MLYERKVRNEQIPTDKTKVIEAVDTESNVHNRFRGRIRILYLYMYIHTYINKKFLRLHRYHSHCEYKRRRMKKNLLCIIILDFVLLSTSCLTPF